MTADEERAQSLAWAQQYALWWTQPDPETAARARRAYQRRYRAFRSQLCWVFGDMRDEEQALYGQGLWALGREGRCG